MFQAVRAVNWAALTSQREQAGDRWLTVARGYVPEMYRLASSGSACDAMALLAPFAELLDEADELWRCDVEIVTSDVSAARRLWIKQGLQPDAVPSAAGAVEFEEASAEGRVRMVVTEMIRLEYIAENTDGESDGLPLPHPLFDAEMLHDMVVMVLHMVSCRAHHLLPVPQMAMRLLFAARSCDLAMAFVQNRPHEVRAVAEAVINSAVKAKAGSWRQVRCMDFLRSVFLMAPLITAPLLEMLVDRRQLAELVVHMALTNYDDVLGGWHFVEFVTGLVYDRASLDWFAQALNGGPAAMYTKQVKEVLLVLSQEKYSDSTHHRMCGLMQVLCVMLRPSSVANSLDPEDVQQVISSITQAVSPGIQGDYFTKGALCVVAACPVLTSQERDQEHIVEWLAGLAEQLTASYAETLRLIAVHFWTNNIRAVADVVREHLGFHIDIPVESLNRLREIFTKKIFPEDVLARSVLQTPPTAGLHAGMTGIFPIHAVYHLLCSRILVKHQVQPGQWILNQILAVSETDQVHRLVPELLNALADFCTDPKGTYLSGNDKPPRLEEQQRYVTPLQRLSEAQLDAALQRANRVARVLLVLYVLTYNQAAHEFETRQMKLGGKFCSVQPYSSKFTGTLPCKESLGYAEHNVSIFGDVFASFLSVALDTYPELFHTLHNMDDHSQRMTETFEETLACNVLENSLSTAPAFLSALQTGSGNLTSEQCSALLSPVDRPTEAYLTLQDLAKTTDDNLELAMDFILDAVLLPVVQGVEVERHIEDTFVCIWHRLSTIAPKRLWTSTVTRLRHGCDGSREKSLRISVEQLVSDPLEILRCDRSVLQRTIVMECILSMLYGLLVGADHRLTNKFASIETRSAGSVPAPFSAAHGEVMKDTMSFTLHSAVVQMLLELCSDDTDVISELQELRVKIFRFVHQIFILLPQLVRLVHLQGYDPALIPLMVLGVPSMHVCADFLGEMLEHPALDKQIFAVQVVGPLAKRYAIPKMLDVARLVVGKGQCMCDADSVNRLKYFENTVNSLVDVCEAFPRLAEGIIALLAKLRMGLESELAVCSPLKSVRAHALLGAVVQAIASVTSKALLDDAL